MPRLSSTSLTDHTCIAHWKNTNVKKYLNNYLHIQI